MKLIGRVDSSEGHYAKEKTVARISDKKAPAVGADIGDVLKSMWNTCLLGGCLWCTQRTSSFTRSAGILLSTDIFVSASRE